MAGAGLARRSISVIRDPGRILGDRDFAGRADEADSSGQHRSQGSARTMTDRIDQLDFDSQDTELDDELSDEALDRLPLSFASLPSSGCNPVVDPPRRRLPKPRRES
jgi:hypothetical protein